MKTPFGWLIGDPHLGKKFEVGVPLHRRGEREAGQMALFKQELATPNVDMIVMVGDLFDHPYVGYGVVKETADAVLEAAAARPEVTYVFIAGNHDLPRNITHVGAYHAFERMVAGRLPNLHSHRSPAWHRGVAFFPWEWDRTAAEQVQEIGEGSDRIKHAVGHWDLKSFGGSDAHLAPTALLKATFPSLEAIWSGHYHSEGDYVVAGHTVGCCGSLEPYSHGEDADGTRYVTLSLDDALSQADTLRHKCVRIRLNPGEELPQLDALAVTAERVRGPVGSDDGGAEALSLASLDWAGILSKKLKPLHPTVRSFITERLSTDDTAEEQL